jgi:hypothetical protein
MITAVLYFLCSSCSYLQHITSVYRFVSLQFLNLIQSVGLLGRGISPSQGRYLTPTHNKRNESSTPWVGLQITIPGLERAKTFHALDRAATAIDWPLLLRLLNSICSTNQGTSYVARVVLREKSPVQEFWKLPPAYEYQKSIENIMQ